MADFNKYFPTLIKHEGKYVDNPNDKGGATKYGVTFAVWLANGYDKDGDKDIDKNDIKLLTPEDAQFIAKKLYWDKIGGDKIESQSIAEFIFDWAYNSGVVTAIKKVQRLLPANIKADGIIGKNTIAAINEQPKEQFFNKLKASRKSFFEAIVRANPSQKVFLKGWMARLNSFVYKN